MKKRVIILSLIAALVLSACGSKVPDGMSERAYNIGLKALEVIRQYNDGDIDQDEALDRIDEYYDRISDIRDSDDNDKDLYLSIYIESFRTALILDSGSTYEAEDKLKELLEVN